MAAILKVPSMSTDVLDTDRPKVSPDSSRRPGRGVVRVEEDRRDGGCSDAPRTDGVLMTVGSMLRVARLSMKLSTEQRESRTSVSCASSSTDSWSGAKDSGSAVENEETEKEEGTKSALLFVT